MNLFKFLLLALLISSCSNDVNKRTDVQKFYFEGHEYLYFSLVTIMVLLIYILLIVFVIIAMKKTELGPIIGSFPSSSTNCLDSFTRPLDISVSDNSKPFSPALSYE